MLPADIDAGVILLPGPTSAPQLFGDGVEAYPCATSEAFLEPVPVLAYPYESGYMLREIVFDTETTGLDPANGDRLIELGCVEIVNRIPTGREFHRYFNPDRDIHREAVAVHGITPEFLKDKPRFAEAVDDFLAFIADAPLVAHNASFDLTFLNAELTRAGRPLLMAARIIDTLSLARRRHPAGPNSLDALCKRYGIDLSQRTKHGALLDSMLLASVYVELLGERQATLGLNGQASGDMTAHFRPANAKQRPAPLPSRLSAEAEAAHLAYVKTLGAEPLWLRYSGA
jgi:DNA polymerase-3 subunit epsilon